MDHCFLGVFSLKFVGISFVKTVFIRIHITELLVILSENLPVQQAHLQEFKHNLFCTHFPFRMLALTLTFIVIQILIHFYRKTYIEICMIYNFFDSFVLVIKLKEFKFTFSVLFRTEILPDILLRILKLLLHLPKSNYKKDNN